MYTFNFNLQVTTTFEDKRHIVCDKSQKFRRFTTHLKLKKKKLGKINLTKKRETKSKPHHFRSCFFLLDYHIIARN